MIEITTENLESIGFTQESDWDNSWVLDTESYHYQIIHQDPEDYDQSWWMHIDNKHYSSVGGVEVYSMENIEGIIKAYG